MLFVDVSLVSTTGRSKNTCAQLQLGYNMESLDVTTRFYKSRARKPSYDSLGVGCGLSRRANAVHLEFFTLHCNVLSPNA